MEKEKKLFFSEEWIKAYVNALNNNSEYERSARDWEGDFIFEIRPDGKTIKEPVRIYIDLYHGKVRNARIALPDDTAEYKYSSTLENWEKLLSNQIGPIKGIISRKFDLDGNFVKVMRYLKAAQELVNTTRDVNTFFQDEV
jgi:putative sterol carrier protein